jgi:hypothetical protein
VAATILRLSWLGWAFDRQALDKSMCVIVCSWHYTQKDERVFMRSITALSILLLFAGPARAAIYYVSQSGNDANSCAAAQTAVPTSQRQTISAGVACLSAGDILYIHSGNYTGPKNTVDSLIGIVRGGTNFSSGAITIAGYPGETVTITPPDGLQGIRLTTAAQRYLIFQDLKIDMINQTTPANGPDGVYLSGGANHNRFLRLEVKNNSTSGFQLSSNNGSADYNEILNCIIHDNGRLNRKNSGYGIYGGTNNTLIEGNDIYANNGYGVHFNPLEGYGNNNVIRKNKIHGNFVHGVTADGGTTSYGIVVMRGANYLIYNNLIYDNQGGIQVYSGNDGTGIYNNTVTRNLASPGNGESGIDMQYYDVAPTIRNNIVYNNDAGAIRDMSATGTPVMDHNLTIDPLFVNATASDFHLKTSSPAVDAGVAVGSVPVDYDGIIRPQGRGYDIGAYEFATPSVLASPQNLRNISAR